MCRRLPDTIIVGLRRTWWKVLSRPRGPRGDPLVVVRSRRVSFVRGEIVAYWQLRVEFIVTRGRRRGSRVESLSAHNAIKSVTPSRWVQLRPPSRLCRYPRPRTRRGCRLVLIIPKLVSPRTHEAEQGCSSYPVRSISSTWGLLGPAGELNGWLLVGTGAIRWDLFCSSWRRELVAARSRFLLGRVKVPISFRMPRLEGVVMAARDGPGELAEMPSVGVPWK